MTAIEQLLRDAMTTYTDDVPALRPGAARTALRSSRRTSRVRLAAASTATVAATAGVGVFVVSFQPATTGTFSGGAPASGANVSGTVPTPVASAKSAAPAPVNANVSASATAPQPVISGYSDEGKVKTAADAPVDLVAVTIAPAVAGLQLNARSDFYTQEGGHWVRSISFNDPGAQWSSGVIMVTKGTATPLWNQAQSPSPSVGALTVAGRAATNWVSGGDHYVFFTAGQFTVEIFSSDSTISTDQLVALGNALQGLPQ